MTSERLRELIKAQPFHPFDIRLADGRAIRVAHSEMALPSPSGRTVVVFQPDDSMTIIDLFLAISLDPIKNGKAAAGGATRRRGRGRA
jgi:hypothetical protein